MILEKRSSGTGFIILFEVENGFFIGKCKIGIEVYWKMVFRSRNVTFLMSINPIIYVIGTTDMRFIINALHTIDMVHISDALLSLVWADFISPKAELLRSESGEGGIRTHNPEMIGKQFSRLSG